MSDHVFLGMAEDSQDKAVASWYDLAITLGLDERRHTVNRQTEETHISVP